VKVTTSTFGTTAITGITYGSGKFFTVFGSSVAVSSDNGANWSLTTSPLNGLSLSYPSITGITYNSGKLVVAGYYYDSTGNFQYSFSAYSINDGSTWTIADDSFFPGTPEGNDSPMPNGISFVNGNFVMYANVGFMAYSAAGSTWKAAYISAFGANGSIGDVIYVNGKYFAVGASGKITYTDALE
jgi:hypothetical protein